MAAHQNYTSVNDVSQFVSHVNENYCCSICFGIPKNPQMCRNEHIFCRDCIKEHLRVSFQRCPLCKEVLTLDTLRPARIVNNLLSQLKSACDYASRGCLEITSVADLATHVENCGFAPVLCSDEQCGQEINKRDLIHHKNMHRNLNCLSDKVETVRKSSLASLQRQEKKVEKKLTEIYGKMEILKIIHDESRKKNEDDVKELRKEIIEAKREMRESVCKVSRDVNEMKVMMKQMMKKMEQPVKLPSPTEGRLDATRKDILIAGGYKNRTTEIFSWKKNKWYASSRMIEGHWQASSFVHHRQLFIVGGYKCRSIETLDLDQLPLQWTKMSGEIPYRSSLHQTVVFQQRVFYIGGCNWYTELGYDVISEIQLASSCVVKELCHMPEARSRHCVEIVDDKILIFGGVDIDDIPLRNVLEFDPKTNTCNEMPPLRHALYCMATVRWRDQVVVLGGKDRTAKVLNRVFKYDCKKGEISVLPSMRKERSGCCAVITGDTIVVMGGIDNDNNVLDSVECFTFGCSSTWEYLPQMTESRAEAIAEVLPSTGKVVKYKH